MDIQENLIKNLKTKYRSLYIPEEEFRKAAIFSKENENKTPHSIFEIAVSKIDEFIIKNAETDETYKKYIIRIIDDRISRFVTRNNLNYSKVTDEVKDKIYNILIYSYDYKAGMNLCIKRILEKELMQYKVESSTKRGLQLKFSEYSDIPVDESKNIKFLEYHLKKNNITMLQFCKSAGLRTEDLYKYFRGISIPSESSIEKILKFFNQSSLNELKEEIQKNDKLILEVLKINNKSKEKNLSLKSRKIEVKINSETLGIPKKLDNVDKNKQDDNQNKNSIMFLDSILLKNKIDLSEFAKKVEINLLTLIDYLKNDTPILNSDLNKILKFLDLKDYNELVKNAEAKISALRPKEEAEEKENDFLDRDYEILKKYLIDNKIKHQTLEEKVGLSINCLRIIFMSKKILPEEEKKLLSFFKISKYEELTESQIDLIMIQEGLKQKEKIDSTKKINLDFFYEYIKRTEYTIKIIADELKVGESTLYGWILKGYIPEDKLSKLLNIFNFKTYEEFEKEARRVIKEESFKKTTSRGEKLFKIDFLDDFLEAKGYSKYEFSNKIDVNNSTVYRWSKNKLVPESQLNKILDFFGYKTYKEFKQQAELLIETSKGKIKNKKADISFFSEYLKCINCSKRKLAQEIGCSPNSILYWVKTGEISQKQLDKILKYFKFETYEEFKEEANKIIEEANNTQKFNNTQIVKIDFLEEYINRLGLSKRKFSQEINIPITTMFSWISKKEFPRNQLEKILEYFKFDSFEEFERVARETIEKTEKVKISKGQRIIKINFLEDYLKCMGISKKAFAEKIQCYSCEKWFIKQEIPENQMKKILEYFKFDSFEEFEKEAKKVISSTSEIPDLNNVKVDFLGDFLNSINCPKVELAKEINVSDAVIYKWIERKKIPKNQLEKILEYFDFKNYEVFEKEAKEIINLKELPEETVEVFLQSYIKNNKLVPKTIAKDLGIKTYELYNWMSINRVPKNKIDIVLKYFNLETLDELNTSFEQKENNKYEIAFLDGYIKCLGITKNYLANKIHVSSNIIKIWITNNSIPENQLNKLLEFFNFENYEEFKSSALEKIENSKGEDNSYFSIDFLKDYLNCIGMTKISLANALNVNEYSIYRWLDNGHISPSKIKVLLDYFGFDTYEEFKASALEKINNTTEYPHKNRKSNSVKFEYLKEALEITGFTINDFCKSLNIKSSLVMYWINNGIIGYKYLKEVLAFFKVNSIEELYELINNSSSSHLSGFVEVEEEPIVEVIEEPKVVLEENPIVEEEKIEDKLINNKKDEVKQTKKEIVKEPEYYIKIYQYLINEDIPIIFFLKRLDIKLSELEDIFKGKKAIKLSELNIVLDELDCDSLDELNEKVKISLEQSKFDLSFLQNINLNKKLFSLYLKVDEETINNWIYKSNNANKKYLKQILEYFKVSTIDELKQKIESIDKNSNLVFILNYLSDKRISLKSFSEIINYPFSKVYEYFYSNKNIPYEFYQVLFNYFKVNNVYELKKKVNDLSKKLDISFINKDLFIKLINEDNLNISKKTYEVILTLLYKTNNINEISKITGYDKKEILTIYKYCIKLYSKYFMKNYNKMLELLNK